MHMYINQIIMLSNRQDVGGANPPEQQQKASIAMMNANNQLSKANSEEEQKAAGHHAPVRSMRPQLQHTQINKIMHNEASSSRQTDEGVDHTGSSKTEDDCSNQQVEEMAEDRIKEEFEEANSNDVQEQSLLQQSSQLVMNQFLAPMDEPRLVINRPSKAQPPAQMKQMQGPAKQSAPAAAANNHGRQSLAISGASSLIELQAMNNNNNNYRQQQRQRNTQSISGSKDKMPGGSFSQPFLLHANTSPPKKTRQKSQASFGQMKTSQFTNYSSMPSMVEQPQAAATMAPQQQTNNNNNAQQKQRRNSPPVQQQPTMSKRKGGALSRRDTSCASGAKETLGSVSLPPRNHISTLAQKTTTTTGRKKPNASLNSRQHSKQKKKTRSLLREQESSPEKIVLKPEDSKSKKASQDEEQPAENQKQFPEEGEEEEEINQYFTSKVEEDDLQNERRSITNCNQAQMIRRASERNRQCMDIEEEKEVPSEHPNNRKITPTRNGCNVTTRKGFSFENNMMVLNQHLQTSSQKALKTNQDVIEAGFVVIDPESSQALLTDIEEMESGQDIIQNSVVSDVSKLPTRTKHMINKSNQMMSQQQQQQQILRTAGLIQKSNQPPSLQQQIQNGRMPVHTSPFQLLSSVPQDDIIFKDIASGRNNPSATAPSNDSVASIEENKAVMKLTKFQQNTQLMPQTTPMMLTGQANRSLHRKQQAFLTQYDQVNQRQTMSNNAANLHQSMASCDLQASFQRNDDTRNPQETTGRTKPMMYVNSGQANIMSEPANITTIQDDNTQQLFGSAEYQAISKTRLWTEIFFLRKLLENKNEMLGKMKGTMAEFQSKLEAEQLRSMAFERQVAELRSVNTQQNSGVRGRLHETSQAEEEKKQAPDNSHLLLHQQLQHHHHYPQPPILQNELVKQHHRQQHQQLEFNKQQQHGIPGHQKQPVTTTNLYSVTEEQDIGVVRRTPHHAIHRASHVHNNNNSQHLHLHQHHDDPDPDPTMMSSHHAAALQDATAAASLLSAQQESRRQQTSSGGSPQPFVNCFNPPTKASQLRIQQPATALRVLQSQSSSAMQIRDAAVAKQSAGLVSKTTSTSKYQQAHQQRQQRQQQQRHQENDDDDDEDEAIDSGHAMPPLGLNMVHATTRAQSALIARNTTTSVTAAPPVLSQVDYCSSSASFLMNPVDEEVEVSSSHHHHHHHLFTQNEEEEQAEQEEEEGEEEGRTTSLLINKVNEMQTKTASFGYQQQHQQQQHTAIPATAHQQQSTNNNQQSNHRFFLYRQQNLRQQQLGNNLIAEQQQVVQDEAIDSSEMVRHPLTFAEQEQFLEYEIDEQVASGVRVMNGPRSGPPRQSIIRQGQQQQVQVFNRQASAVAQQQQQQQQQQMLTSQTTLSTHNQIEIPPTLQTQQAAFNNNHQQTQPSLYQNTQLQQQRPCDQPPPRNIQGDVQSHVDAEEISNVEGVGSGLVPQQRIPLPNQQQQAMPRQPSHDDSLLEPPDSHPQLRHHRLQPQLQQQLQYVPVGFSFADDAGMDEFDVADERLHLFGEQVNPDIMTYEQLLALQERIGFVPKGMTVQEMDKYPTMKRSQVRRYLRQGSSSNHHQHRLHRRAKVDNQTRQDPTPKQEQAQALQDLDRPGHDLPAYSLQVGEEEEKKSLLESNADKSSLHYTIHDSYDHGSFTEKVQDRSMHSSACGADMAMQQLQLENYQSMQNSRTSTTFINNGRMSNQIRSQVRQRGITCNNFKVPMIELQSDQGGEENHELSSIKTRHPSTSQLLVNLNQFNSPPGEEGKEDLEEAAPEEHHPKEEHLQQIGVSVPMPGHHIASHSGMAASMTTSNQQMMIRMNIRKNSNHHLSAQQLLPNNNLNSSCINNQVIVVSEEEEQEDNNQSQEGASQEDVFDEGEDVLNRRLPIVVNINGSIPNQRPSSQHPQQMHQQIAVDFERQHPLYAGAIAIQNNLARQSRIVTKQELQQQVEDADLCGVNSTSSNIYEEHNEDEFGVQAPKYAQTKTNQKQQRHEKMSSLVVGGGSQDNQIYNNEVVSSTIRHADQPTLVKHHGQPTMAGRHTNISGVKAAATHSGNLSLTQQRQSVQSSTPSLAESSNVSTQLGSEICIVCQEIFTAEDPVKVLKPCEHYFHVDCVNQWLLVEKKCPMCMNPLD